MAQVAEAVYSGGVLKPTTPLDLKESQRVRLVLEPIEPAGPEDREAALDRLRKGIEQMQFRSTAPYPTRDDLHDRV